MRRQMAGAVVLGVVIAGCGGSDDLLDRVPPSQEEPEEAPAAEADPADESAADAPSGPSPDADPPDETSAPSDADADATPQGAEAVELDPAEFPTIDERSIDQVVQYGQLEWAFEDMTVVDLDTDLQAGEQPQGVQLTFTARVFNAGGSTASVTGTPVALQWDDPATGDTFTLPVQADFREVPAESFGSGELSVAVPHEDRTMFDDESAYLLVGRPGATPAVVPVGSAVEAVDRLPVPQDTDGWTFDIEGEDTARRTMADTVTVTDAEVRWTGPEGMPLEDGTSLLEITYTIENRGEGQTCSQRSEGGWRLTLPDGDSVNDLRVSERCVSAGDTVTGILTGFLLPTEEFAGDYVLLHRRGSGSSDPEGEVEIALVDGDGARPSGAD